jgi:hypothetical protein
VQYIDKWRNSEMILFYFGTALLVIAAFALYVATDDSPVDNGK